MLLFQKNHLFSFSTNADAANALVFGKDMNTWLIYTLIILGLTFFAFVWVWLAGLVHDRKAE